MSHYAPNTIHALPAGTKMYHKTWQKFNPIEIRSHFFTVYPPSATRTDTGQRVLVYKTTIPYNTDKSNPGHSCLKHQICETIMCRPMRSPWDLNTKEICKYLLSIGFDGMVTRIDDNSEIEEHFICHSGNSVLEFFESYIMQFL